MGYRKNLLYAIIGLCYAPSLHANPQKLQAQSTLPEHTLQDISQSVPQNSPRRDILQDSAQSSCDDLCQAITKRTIVSKDKSAKYFGVGVGVSLLNSSKGGNFNINNNVQSPYTNPIIIPSFGVRMGAISFFNRYVGVRGFFGFDMGFGAHSGMLTMISAGVDAIVEFPLSRRRQVFFGGILGMGADAYLYFDKKDYNHWGAMKKAGEVFMQVGFTTMLGIHNRVNLVYRFLPARRASYFSPTGVVSLEYNFLF